MQRQQKKHLKTKTVFSVIKKTRQVRVFFCVVFYKAGVTEK
jgi:hypothetical protein